MSLRTAAWLAWLVSALSLMLTAFGLLLVSLDLSQPDTRVYDYWVENTILALAFSVVGGVVASRRPGEPIGWLFCSVGFIGGIRLLSSEYAIHSLLAKPGSLPGGLWRRPGSPRGFGSLTLGSWCSWRCCSLTANYLHDAGGHSRGSW